jgi:hypothetical protein
MPTDLILLVGAIVISWLVFTALLKVVKTTITTALVVAMIIFALQFLFGINPAQLWRQISELPQMLWQLLPKR